MVKNPPAMQETWVRSLAQEDPLEKEMVTHCNILTWETPWTEETGGLQLYFCGVSCNVSFFISDFVYLNHFSFFLVLAKDLSFKKMLLVPLIISIIFLIPILFISTLNLLPFF